MSGRRAASSKGVGSKARARRMHSCFPIVGFTEAFAERLATYARAGVTNALQPPCEGQVSAPTLRGWFPSSPRIRGRWNGEEGLVFPMRRLDIYLNDHFAGAMLGVELSRRAAAENRGTELGVFLGALHRQIVDERHTLRAVMSALGIDASPLKPAGAWLLEKAGRLKLNGQVRGHSPLSPLVELEGLEAGVSGKRSLWQVLGRAFPADERLERFHLDALVARADEQLKGLQEHRLALAPNALREEHSPRATPGSSAG
jgi:hypothetical protein